MSDTLANYMTRLYAELCLNIINKPELESAWGLLIKFKEKYGIPMYEVHQRYQSYYDSRLRGLSHLTSLKYCIKVKVTDLPAVVFEVN